MLRGLLITLFIVTVGPFVAFILGSILYYQALGLYAVYQSSRPGYVEPWQGQSARVAIGNVVFVEHQRIFTSKVLAPDQPKRSDGIQQAARLEFNLFARADGSLTRTPPEAADDQAISRVLVVLADAGYAPFGNVDEASLGCTDGPGAVCQQTFTLEKDRLAVRLVYRKSQLSLSASYESDVKRLIGAWTSTSLDYGLPR